MKLSISLNGQPRELPAPWRIADLVADLGFTGKRVAVEVNGEIVPKSRYGSTGLAADDRVEIVIAVGGG